MVLRTLTGQFVPVSVQVALDVVEATKTLDKQLFKRAEQHNGLMRASADPANYDSSTGWPAQFVDAI